MKKAKKIKKICGNKIRKNAKIKKWKVLKRNEKKMIDAKKNIRISEEKC